jgi:hypothetical protein
MPTNGQFVVGEIVSAADANQYFSRGSRNMLINGDFRVAQRGTSFVSGANNDDTYNLDRWTLLSDGNDIVDVTQSTTAPTAGLYSIGLDVETINKKFGIIQFVEQRNMVGALGQVVTLSFQARISGTSISNVKAVVLAWSGTADTVTSDVVSAWGADGVTPTFATNWTAENTPSNLAVTSSWATYRIQATIDTANTKNLAVFIWCDDTTTTLGDFLYLTDIQLEIGAVASPFERRSYGEELAFCQRYYFRWTSESAFGSVMIAALWSTTAHYGHMRFPVTMRVNPTTGGRSNAGDFLGYWYATTFATATAVTVDTGTATTNTIEVQFTFATGTTSSASFIRGSSSAWIEVGAEL